MRCISIKMTPEAIGFHRNFMSRPPQSAFKDCMLNEMADSVKFRRFVSGTASDPDSSRNRPETGHMLRQNDYAIWQARGLNLIYHARISRIGRKTYLVSYGGFRILARPQSSGKLARNLDINSAAG